MRIKEVIEKTGLSRRTIQFYISQKLIMPKEDPVNGYHDFSDDDVRNLIIISWNPMRKRRLPPMILRSWTRESSLFLYGRPIFPEPAVNTRNSSGAKFPGR